MPEAKFEIKRKCEVCGATFIANTLESRYCSRSCTQKAYKQRKAQEKKTDKLNQLAIQIPEDRDYISVPEAEALFGVSQDTIRRLVRLGEIHCINLGKRLTRVSKQELKAKYPLREMPMNRSTPQPHLYNMEPENCYTIGEISAKFGVSEATVNAHIRKNSIPIRQIGNYVYAPKPDINHLYKDVIKK